MKTCCILTGVRVPGTPPRGPRLGVRTLLTIVAMVVGLMAPHGTERHRHLGGRVVLSRKRYQRRQHGRRGRGLSGGIGRGLNPSERQRGPDLLERLGRRFGTRSPTDRDQRHPDLWQRLCGAHLDRADRPGFLPSRVRGASNWFRSSSRTRARGLAPPSTIKAISKLRGPVLRDNSTANAAGDGSGGAIVNVPGSTCNIIDSVLTDNTAGLRGGAIRNGGALTVKRSRFSRNRVLDARRLGGVARSQTPVAATLRSRTPCWRATRSTATAAWSTEGAIYTLAGLVVRAAVDLGRERRSGTPCARRVRSSWRAQRRFSTARSPTTTRWEQLPDRGAVSISAPGLST